MAWEWPVRMPTRSRRELYEKEDENCSLKNAQSHFRYLDLPSEIRNEINYWVVVQPEPISFGRFVKPFTQPALTRVNRQVREETLTMFYTKNRFAFSLQSLDDRTIRWLTCRGTRGQQLAAPELTVHDWEYVPEDKTNFMKWLEGFYINDWLLPVLPPGTLAAESPYREMLSCFENARKLKEEGRLHWWVVSAYHLRPEIMKLEQAIKLRADKRACAMRLRKFAEEKGLPTPLFSSRYRLIGWDESGEDMHTDTVAGLRCL